MIEAMLMKRQLLPTVLLLILLSGDPPTMVHGQERAGLFDIEVDDEYTLVDPGRLAFYGWWQVDGAGSGLFDQRAVMEGVAQPRLLLIEGDELFVVDGLNGTQVLVYSLPELELQMSLGGGGEGPGEFTVRPGHRVGLDVTEDRILVTGGSKVALFDRGGKLLGETPFPFWTQWDFQVFGEGYVGQGSRPDEYSYQLNLYDSGLQRRREILDVANPVSGEGGPIRVLTTSLRYRVHGNEVYAWGHTPDFVIEVFDRDGVVARSLRPQYDRVPVTDEVKAMILQAYAANPGFADRMDELRERILFPSHLPAIWDCWFDDNTIYVLTYERRGWEFKMLLLDRQGNPLGGAWLPVSLSPAGTPYPATVHQGNWYQVAKNHETGTWELVVLDIAR
jgi:hypothetical protein